MILEEGIGTALTLLCMFAWPTVCLSPRPAYLFKCLIDPTNATANELYCKDSAMVRQMSIVFVEDC